MKKNLFFHFSVLAMLIVLISACSSKKPEYTNVIPSDASQVIAVNLKSLADKAGTKDKETKEALQKLTDALKSDMNAATFQQLEAVLKDPAKSGVDVNAPIYVFNAPSFPYTTMVAKVQSEDDLLKLLEVTEKEQIISHVAEADGYSFAQINKRALLAFTPTTLMMVNYTGTSQLENAKAGWRHQYAHLSFQPAECIRQSAELRNIPQYRPERLEDAGKSLLRKRENRTESRELYREHRIESTFRKANQKYLSHRKHVLEVFPKIYPGAIQHRYQWRRVLQCAARE